MQSTQIRINIFLFLFCLSVGSTTAKAQETVFDKPQTNALYVNLGLALFTDISVNYRKLLTPQNTLQQGFALSAGLWMDISVLSAYDGSTGKSFTGNYVLLVHSNKRKYSYYEFNLGVKFLNNRYYQEDSLDSYRGTFYPGIATPNMFYRHQYFFMPTVFMGRVFQKNDLYMRFGIGYPSMIQTGIGFRF